MRSIINFFLLLTGIALLIASCTKVEPLPLYSNGIAPDLSVNATSFAPAVADSNKPLLVLNWTDPKYATDSSHVKYVIEIDTAKGSFAKPFTRTITTGRTTSFTGRDLNSLVLNYGYTLGRPVNLDFRVKSSYANNNETYTSNVQRISITPYNDPSLLTSTASTVTGSLATASQKALTFSWSQAFKGYNSTVTYSLQYDSSGKNFSSPQEMAIGASIYSRDMTQGEINQTAIDEGVIGGTTGKIEYRIKAVTASGATAYSNLVAVTINSYVSILRFYLPGSYQNATGNGKDWDPATAPEFIRDQRNGALNRLYYIYIYLPAGSLFKITQGRIWDINYGDDGSGSQGLSAGGGNISVSTAGVYRISVDVSNKKYDIIAGRMGFVGDAATNVGWDPTKVFPTSQMAFLGTNNFLGVYNFSLGGWKMIDNNKWNDGSQSVSETRSYGSTGSSGSPMVINADNFPSIATADTYRVIWDGTDPNNIKYEIYSGLRVVGAFQGWNPGTATPMNYVGNGKWSVTITLPAGDFKFVSADGWDFNYGGSSGKISRGGPNLTVAAGTYTITVDEYNQTYTIQ